ncbi:MAG TPA: heparan-alpha-glucosaminide N-acetyltransferase [Casimicrobiaceae bacterium]
MNTARARSTARFDDAARERDTPSAQRVASIDALRAIALIAMIAYHFCFDLRYFRIIAPDFEHDPFWLTARTIILSSFLLLAGVSLVLADARKASSARFWRHVGMIAGCAVLVSASSYLMFPTTFIWFGVLHAIVVSLVIGRPLVRRPRSALIVGLAVIAAGITLSNPAFDGFALGWIGFMTSKPYTEDYVPLFPWAGVLFCGIAVGHALVRNRFAILSSLATPPRWLAWLGRHTLAIYMLHQPILFGALWLIARH